MSHTVNTCLFVCLFVCTSSQNQLGKDMSLKKHLYLCLSCCHDVTLLPFPLLLYLRFVNTIMCRMATVVKSTGSRMAKLKSCSAFNCLEAEMFGSKCFAFQQNFEIMLFFLLFMVCSWDFCVCVID